MNKSPEAFRTISEVAEDLDLPQHVLRFWETRFTQIRPMKRGGGRRYYRPEDIDLLRGIRALLYGEGYTIRGVQRILKEQGPKSVMAAGRGEMPRGAAAAAARRETREMDDEARRRGAAPEGLPGRGEGEAGEAEADLFATAGEGAGEAAAEAEPEAGREVSETSFGPVFETRAPTAVAGLSKEDAERLRATLADLLECKRLLDQAR